MKRLISVILIAALVLGCFASCAPNDTADSSSKVVSSNGASSKDSSSEVSSSNDVPSGALSSLLPSSQATPSFDSSSKVTSSVSTVNYFDVDAEVARRGLSKSQDVSVCFKTGVAGYIINGGPYKVDEETLVRLTQTPVAGNGSVKWKSYSEMGKSMNPDTFDGIVPVSKLHDPVFMSAALPSELQTYMDWRINATNMAPAESKYRKLVSIGAIYKEKDTVLPDDAEITVCLGKITLLARTQEKGWFVANQMAHPAAPNKIYLLPWSLEHTLGTTTIPSGRIKTYSDHVEIKLTGAMLNGTYNVPDEHKSEVEGSVLHFWGTNWTFADGADVQGCVAGYVAWIKEPEYVGKVAAAVGADWRTSSNEVSQAFSGYNYKLTTEPRLIFGHNVGPIAYDDIMDTEKVQELLGLK